MWQVPSRVRVAYRQGGRIFYYISPDKAELGPNSKLFKNLLINHNKHCRWLSSSKVLSTAKGPEDGAGGDGGAGKSGGAGKGAQGGGGGDNQLLCPKCGSPCEHVATFISSTR